MQVKDEIIEMARQAGFNVSGELILDDMGYVTITNRLEAFAKLVRNDYSNKHAQLWLKRIDEAVKAEREACAKVCEDNATDLSEGDWDSACINCADHIRERGEE